MLSLLVLLAGQAPEPPSAYDQNGKRAGYLAKPALIAHAAKLVGTAAPAWRAADTKGRRLDSKVLYRKPTLLVFIEFGCPCCEGAQRYFDRIADAYRGTANFVGVLYGPASAAKAWKTYRRTPFAIVADPKGEIARSYEAQVGLAVRLIAPNGNIVLSTPGYSVKVLEEVASQMGTLGKQKPRKVVTKPAPEAMASGCPLGSNGG